MTLLLISLFLVVKVGNLFGSRRSTIITLYNGAFDSSSALFLVIKVTNAHISLSFMFFRSQTQILRRGTKLRYIVYTFSFYLSGISGSRTGIILIHSFCCTAFCNQELLDSVFNYETHIDPFTSVIGLLHSFKVLELRATTYES